MSEMHHMNETTGVPGLLLIANGWIMQYLHHIDKANVTFILGMMSTSLAIAYYSINIYKSLKKKS
jgi:hypothetical protein